MQKIRSRIAHQNYVQVNSTPRHGLEHGRSSIVIILLLILDEVPSSASTSWWPILIFSDRILLSWLGAVVFGNYFHSRIHIHFLSTNGDLELTFALMFVKGQLYWTVARE